MMHANEAIKQVIAQIDDLLAQMDAQDYRRCLPEFDGSTLGQHFRHILEFFQCLEKGIARQMVDYAARERNLLYEENPAIAAAAFEHFSHVLDSADELQSLQVRAEFGGSDRPVYQSTLGRELLFVYDHAIHHLAIIKIGIRCHFPQLQVNRNLGISPSTIKARELSA